MLIKFQIKYKYNPSNENFEAWVSARLPKNPTCPEVNSNFIGKLNGLEVRCGEVVGDSVIVTFYFSDCSLKRLESRIFREIQRYKHNVETNTKRYNKMKMRKKEFALEFPDPITY